MILLFKSVFYLIILLGTFLTGDARALKKPRQKKASIKSPELHIKNNGLQFLNNQLNKNNLSIYEKLMPQVTATKNHTFLVRVLLDESAVNQTTSWRLSNEDGFFLADSSNTKSLKNTDLIVLYKANNLYLNGNRFNAKKCTIIPQKGYVTFNGRLYAGFFVIERTDSAIYLINIVELEEYIASVLNSESWPGWPVEVNKAFAIASRSYLVSKILASSKQKKPYHIKNTNIHQTYRGIHTSERLRQAIEQTRGLILTYNKKPVEAMFDSCCGGIIPARISHVNFKKTPYLARAYPCSYCKSCKIYSWSVQYPTELIETILNKAGHAIQRIKEIKINKKDGAGVVQSVAIKGHNKSLLLTGKQMYSLFNKLKSFCYSVEKRGKDIFFSGRGYGHHLGICQWGARRMIDKGINFASILQFYYPGTTLMELRNCA